MKKNLIIFLLTVLALKGISANAAVISASESKAIISKAVIENCRKYTDAQIAVDVMAVPFKELTVPEGKTKFVVTSTMDRFMQRSLEKVCVYTDGKLVKSFSAPVVVYAYKDVLVASEVIQRDEALSNSNVKVQKINVAANLDYIFTQDMLAKKIITNKQFRAGEVIDKRFVKFKPDVQRNESVSVIFNSNNLKISVQGTSLSNGMIGDYVTVEGNEYKKIYTGKVIDENTVLVKI